MAQPRTQDRESLRFAWSHRHPVHIAVVKALNALMRLVPLRFKYWVGGRLRGGRYPYALVGPDDVAVQIGSPHDTLHAGRNRGMHFALRTTGTGHTVIVEPDERSATSFEDAARVLGLRNVTVVRSGAWSHSDRLSFYVDEAHPAANFTDGTTAAYTEEEKQRFRQETIRVRAVDDILDDLHLPVPRVVSATTNGAEREIVAGMARTIEEGLGHIALARTDEGYDELMASIGFELLSHDDRGFTYRRTAS